MVESKRVIITGVAGQDGSFLADLLVEKGYEVHGVIRRHSQADNVNLRHLLAKGSISLHEADLCDQASIEHVLTDVKPDEFFNLGAQSHVGSSFLQPEFTVNATGVGPMRVFEAVRKLRPSTRVYQASSSEMYGRRLSNALNARLSENDSFEPASPYGCAKVLAHNLARVYRDGYGLHISSGILFNHESERRGPNFVTRKITLALARMQHGLQDSLELGNLDASRDWGYAPEYMECAWRMLQRDEPGDYVVATGVGHTVQDFLSAALKYVPVDIAERVRSVPSEHRPLDIDVLVGNAMKARQVLDWRPKTDFYGLVRIMMEHDLKLAERERVTSHAF